jgi:hypothetical protein
VVGWGGGCRVHLTLIALLSFWRSWGFRDLFAAAIRAQWACCERDGNGRNQCSRDVPRVPNLPRISSVPRVPGLPRRSAMPLVPNRPHVPRRLKGSARTPIRSGRCK